MSDEIPKEDESELDVVDKQILLLGLQHQRSITCSIRMANCAGDSRSSLMNFDELSGRYIDRFADYLGKKISDIIDVYEIDPQLIEFNKDVDWKHNKIYDLHVDSNPQRAKQRLEIYKSTVKSLSAGLFGISVINNDPIIFQTIETRIGNLRNELLHELDLASHRINSIEKGIDLIIETLSKESDQERIQNIITFELAKLDFDDHSFHFIGNPLNPLSQDKSRSFYSVIAKRLISMRHVIQLMPEEEISDKFWHKFRRKIPQIRKAHLLGLDSVIELVKRKKEQSNIIV